MLKGGYQIIDFKNKLLEVSQGMVYEGVYDIIESAEKTLLISGLFIDTSADLDNGGIHIPDYFATRKINGSNFEIEIPYEAIEGDGNVYLTITDTDVVTLTEP